MKTTYLIDADNIGNFYVYVYEKDRCISIFPIDENSYRVLDLSNSLYL